MKQLAYLVASLALCLAACSKEAPAEDTATAKAQVNPAKTEADPSQAGKVEQPASGDSSCEKLVAALCAGKDCDKAQRWLNEKIAKGPNGEDLTDSQKQMGCQAILGSEPSLSGYKTAYAAGE